MVPRVTNGGGNQLPCQLCVFSRQLRKYFSSTIGGDYNDLKKTDIFWDPRTLNRTDSPLEWTLLTTLIDQARVWVSESRHSTY